MNWKKRAAQCSLFLSLIATKSAFADSACWDLLGGGDWVVDGNWIYPGGGSAHPNVANDIATFSKMPSGGGTITSSGFPITIGHLVSSATSNFTIDFGIATPLIFNTTPGVPATIDVTSLNLTIANPITVLTADGLYITAGGNSNTVGLGPGTILNVGPLVLSGTGTNVFSIGAPYFGDMISVKSAFLAISATSAGTPVISCRGIVMYPGTDLSTNNVNDLFDHNCTVTLQGGALSFNAPLSGTHTIGHLVCYGTTLPGSFGEVRELGGISFLEITNTLAPLCTPITQPITIGANGLIHISNILLSGGGSIVYDSLKGGHGTFSGSGTASGFMTIDLGTNAVVLDVPSGGNIDYDLNFFDVQFFNGVLFKDSSGIVLFEGTQGVLAPLTLYDGTVTIGRSASDVVSTGGSITLFAPSLLNGFGTLGFGAANIINERGTVNPGSPTTIGTLTIRGNYTQQENGNLLIKGLNAAQTDKLVVSIGKATLDGTLTFQALPGASYSDGESVVILDSSAGEPISGRFSSFQSNLPPCLSAYVQYDPNQVLLFFSACGAPPEPIQTLFSNYINLAIPVFNLANARMMELQNRLDYVRSRLSHPVKHKEELAFLADAGEGFLLSSPQTQKPKDTDSTPPPVITATRFREREKERPLSVYIAPLGSLGDVDGISKQRGFSFHSLGGVLGLDYAWSRIGIGASLTYERLHGHVDHKWGHFSLQTVMGKLYTTFLPMKNRHFFVDAAIDIGHNLYHIHRNTTQLNLKGKTHGWQGDGFLGIGYDFLWSHIRATPLASVQFSYLNISHYDEKDPFGLTVHVEDQSSRSTRASLGGSIGGTWKKGSVTWLPEVRGAWQYELTPQKHHLSISSVDFNSVTQVPLFGGDHIYVTGGAALRTLFNKRWSALASYDYYWNSDSRSQLFYLELSAAF